MQVISSSNLTLYPKTLQLVDAVTKVISFTKPFAVCVEKYSISVKFTGWKMLMKSYGVQGVSFHRVVLKKLRQKVAMSVLQNCQKAKFYLFDDYGEIPDCVKSLKSYNEYRKLAIGSLFYSTFKPSGYTYLHSVGDI